MNIKRALGKVSSAYVRSARTFFLIFAVVGLVLWSFGAYAQQPGSVSLNVWNVQLSYPNLMSIRITGTVSTVSPNGNLGPITFSGWVNMTYKVCNFCNEKWTNVPLTFNPSSVSYSNGRYQDSNFDGSQQVTPTPDVQGLTITGYCGKINAFAGNEFVGSTMFGCGAQGTSSDAMFKLIVQLPLINDPMLGATVQPGEPTMGDLGGLYNILMIVGFVLVLMGSLIFIFTNREKLGLGPIIMNAFISVVVILLFPLIYNEVARLINSLDIAIITYPNFQPTPDAAISRIWSQWASVNWSNIWNIIWAGLQDAAVGIMKLIAYLMMYFLGIIRLLLIAILAIAFPLAVGLRLIPFGGKLSSMVEDTLFGLMLASIMSALVLGVASQILSNYGQTYFASVVDQSWVAIAAIFAAILMPTVFAPLTGIMMQTVSQAAMVGAGTAASIAAGVAMPAAGGIKTGLQAGMGAFSTAVQQAGGWGQGLGQNIKTGLTAFGKGLRSFAGTFVRHAGPHIAKNATLLGTTGILSSVGATQAAKVLSGMAGGPSTHADVVQSYQKAQIEKLGGQQFEAFKRLNDKVQRSTEQGFSVAPVLTTNPSNGHKFRPHINWKYSPKKPTVLAQQWFDKQYNEHKQRAQQTDEAIARYFYTHGAIDDKTLENPVAVQKIAKDYRDWVSHLDTHTVRGRLEILNHKRHMDYLSWLKREGIDPHSLGKLYKRVKAP